MKTIKIKTDLGIQEVKPKKIFECKTHFFALVEYNYKYMNSSELSTGRKIVHLNTGIGIPVYAQSKQTLKDFIRVGINTIESIFYQLGDEKFNQEINKHETIN